MRAKFLGIIATVLTAFGFAATWLFMQRAPAELHVVKASAPSAAPVKASAQAPAPLKNEDEIAKEEAVKKKAEKAAAEKAEAEKEAKAEQLSSVSKVIDAKVKPLQRQEDDTRAMLEQLRLDHEQLSHEIDGIKKVAAEKAAAEKAAAEKAAAEKNAAENAAAQKAAAKKAPAEKPAKKASLPKVADITAIDACVAVTANLEAALESLETYAEVPVRGPGGLCTSCTRAGHVYMEGGEPGSDIKTLKSCGVLSSVQLTGGTPTLSKLVEDRIYAIEEYHLGEGMPPFRWATVTCATWFGNMCLRNEALRAREGGSWFDQVFWSRGWVSRWDHWIEPGSNVIDIGANVGDTTIEMALKGPKRTIAIEAHPGTVQHAQLNAVLNPWLNITVYPLAIADADGTMDFIDWCGGCNNGPAETFPWNGNHIQVPKRKFDTWLMEEFGAAFIEDLSFIKIDTEGYDKTILRAYKPLLAIKKPIFFVEWFDPWWDGQSGAFIHPGSKDLFAAIEEIGYVPINPQTGKLVPGPESRHGDHDLLLLPRERWSKTTEEVCSKFCYSPWCEESGVSGSLPLADGVCNGTCSKPRYGIRWCGRGAFFEDAIGADDKGYANCAGCHASN